MLCLAEDDLVLRTWSLSHRCVFLTLLLLLQLRSAGGLWGGCVAAGVSTGMASP